MRYYLVKIIWQIKINEFTAKEESEIRLVRASTKSSAGVAADKYIRFCYPEINIMSINILDTIVGD